MSGVRISGTNVIDTETTVQSKTRILTSATDSEDIPAFTGIKNPKKLNYLNIPVKEKRLSVFYVQSPEKDKLETLLSLLQNIDPGLTLIFCNQRESVERINWILTSKRIINEAFHGGMEQPDRERALCKFRNQSSFILVSTDLAARGLDIPEVKHIIHYHLPLDEETYIHRNGRTARMHADGNAYLILGSTEQMPEYVKKDARTITLSPTTIEPAVPPMTTLHFQAGKRKTGKRRYRRFPHTKRRNWEGRYRLHRYQRSLLLRSNKPGESP